MSDNGQRPQDTKGEQGRQEGPQGFHLQQSPSATDGDDGREKEWKLVHLENTSQGRTLRIQAETPAEVMAGIFREVPSLSTPKLTIELFTKAIGSSDRTILVSVNTLSEIWATVYLRKH